MTIDEYIANITSQLGSVKSNAEAAEVIRVSVTNMTEKKKNRFIIQRYLHKLRLAIENISPLTCSSDQWSYYRFALVYIGNTVSKEAAAE
ncbi:hypothetical protein ACTJJ0_26785 [Chitinophaga sp. 22321]|uniref:Uncharacterized protein n=1 Tax=Chitinophaga hostae TaxID=2831022 RepID=A0ABS5J6N4_9BACT|nr:hypothetical protein [Chitinophaga hostae]MBS0030718.1 hypothetical protein [Chitinophaga hostae]